MENLTKTDLLDIVDNTDNPIIKSLGKKKMQEEFKGDVVAQKMLQLSQLLSSFQSKPTLDEDEIKKLIREEIETDKIKFDDLDDNIKKLLANQSATLNVTVTQGGVVKTYPMTIDADIKRPLVQKVLSDLLARNNVYLYGGAGTGKTYMAKTIKNALDWELITVNCNQFTSQLELLGGQTIDGYQEGKVVRAYGNLNQDGTPMGKGCILLLDELPKLDPNTAGILNAVLASVGEYDKKGNPSPIQNSKGDVIQRGDCFILATGNSLLNTKDAEYEANFKQDLSLQDRFAGSTYKVVVDEEFEWNNILNKKWAFIFIYLVNLRRLIQNEGFTNKAFVSIRLMQSVQKTYNVFRQYKDSSSKSYNFDIKGDISFTPADVQLARVKIQKETVKSVQDSMDEFFSLFTPEQADVLKTKSNYDEWKRIVREKNKLPIDQINTQEELDEIEQLLK